MTTPTTQEIQQAGTLARFEMARRSFQKFLPYIQIIEPGTGMVPMDVRVAPGRLEFVMAE